MKCMWHQDKEANFTCLNCGQHFCPECVKETGEIHYCPNCHPDDVNLLESQIKEAGVGQEPPQEDYYEPAAQEPVIETPPEEQVALGIEELSEYGEAEAVETPEEVEASGREAFKAEVPLPEKKVPPKAKKVEPEPEPEEEPAVLEPEAPKAEVPLPEKKVPPKARKVEPEPEPEEEPAVLEPEAPKTEVPLPEKKVPPEVPVPEAQPDTLEEMLEVESGVQKKPVAKEKADVDTEPQIQEPEPKPDWMMKPRYKPRTLKQRAIDDIGEPPEALELQGILERTGVVKTPGIEPGEDMGEAKEAAEEESKGVREIEREAAGPVEDIEEAPERDRRLLKKGKRGVWTRRAKAQKRSSGGLGTLGDEEDEAEEATEAEVGAQVEAVEPEALEMKAPEEKASGVELPMPEKKVPPKTKKVEPAASKAEVKMPEKKVPPKAGKPKSAVKPEAGKAKAPAEEILKSRAPMPETKRPTPVSRTKHPVEEQAPEEHEFVLEYEEEPIEPFPKAPSKPEAKRAKAPEKETPKAEVSLPEKKVPPKAAKPKAPVKPEVKEEPAASKAEVKLPEKKVPPKAAKPKAPVKPEAKRAKAPEKETPKAEVSLPEKKVPPKTKKVEPAPEVKEEPAALKAEVPVAEKKGAPAAEKPKVPQKEVSREVGKPVPEEAPEAEETEPISEQVEREVKAISRKLVRPEPPKIIPRKDKTDIDEQPSTLEFGIPSKPEVKKAEEPEKETPEAVVPAEEKERPPAAAGQEAQAVPEPEEEAPKPEVEITKVPKKEAPVARVPVHKKKRPKKTPDQEVAPAPKLKEEEISETELKEEAAAEPAAAEAGAAMQEEAIPPEIPVIDVQLDTLEEILLADSGERETQVQESEAPEDELTYQEAEEAESFEVVETPEPESSIEETVGIEAAVSKAPEVESILNGVALDGTAPEAPAPAEEVETEQGLAFIADEIAPDRYEEAVPVDDGEKPYDYAEEVEPVAFDADLVGRGEAVEYEETPAVSGEGGHEEFWEDVQKPKGEKWFGKLGGMRWRGKKEEIPPLIPGYDGEEEPEEPVEQLEEVTAETTMASMAKMKPGESDESIAAATADVTTLKEEELAKPKQRVLSETVKKLEDQTQKSPVGMRVPEDYHGALTVEPRYIRAVLYGILAGAMGGAAYAGFSHWLNREYGILCWVIGFAVGLAVVYGSGKHFNWKLGVAAASITVVSLSFGRILSYMLGVWFPPFNLNLPVSTWTNFTTALSTFAENLLGLWLALALIGVVVAFLISFRPWPFRLKSLEERELEQQRRAEKRESLE